jgi:hypothetical protein
VARPARLGLMSGHGDPEQAAGPWSASLDCAPGPDQTFIGFDAAGYPRLRRYPGFAGYSATDGAAELRPPYFRTRKWNCNSRSPRVGNLGVPDPANAVENSLSESYVLCGQW